MNETQGMAPANSLALLSNKCEHIVVFQEEICDAGVATTHGEAHDLDEPGRVHVAGNVRPSSLEELHVTPELEHYGIVHDAMDNDNELDVAPGHRGEGVVVVAKHINLARKQQLFIFLVYVADVDLVINWLQAHVSGMMERSQHFEEVRPGYDSIMEVITQHHSPSFVTIQKVGRLKWVDKGVYSGEKDDATATIDAVLAEGSLQLCSMRWVNLTKTVLHILDLVDYDPDVYELVSSSVNVMDVNGRARLVVRCLDELEFVVLLKGWTRKGGCGSFWGATRVVA